METGRKNNMKKTIRMTALFLAAVMIFAVTGCGKTSIGRVELYTGPALVNGQVPEPPTTEAETASQQQNQEDGQSQEEAGQSQEGTGQGQEAEPVSPVDIANDKPVILYFMDYETNTAKKLSTYAGQWDDTNDLATFGAINTDQESISFTSEIEMHKQYWDAVNTSVNYKIGYEISFDVDGEHKVFTILSPADVEGNPDLFAGDVASGNVTGYLGVWLYDDYHQDGGWYSHVTAAEYTDTTLLTSIKVRLTPQYAKVSNLKIKGFSYSSDLEFDANRHYNGVYGYEVTITQK